MEPKLSLMRWLMVAFLLSVVALVAAAAGMAYHIWRERSRRRRLGLAAGKVEETEIEEAQ